MTHAVSGDQGIQAVRKVLVGRRLEPRQDLSDLTKIAMMQMLNLSLILSQKFRHLAHG